MSYLLDPLVLYYAIEWALRLLALFVVPKGRRPTAGMAWLLVIFLLPPLGWLVFLMFGSTKLPRGRRHAQRTLDGLLADAMAALASQQQAEALIHEAPKKYQSMAHLAESLTHLPPFRGNIVAPLGDYNGAIERIIQDVDAATRFVHIEYYILALDDVTEPLFVAMARAVERGVVVRVLYDAFGSRKFPRRREMLRRLRADGVLVQAMLPFRLIGTGYTRPDLRNHRKLVIIDGRVGYTGSQNLVRRDYHRRDDIVYDELVVRMEGPLAVQLEAVFLTDWHAETGEIPAEFKDISADVLTPRGETFAHAIPSGPGYDYENNLKVFNSVLYAAEKSITIVNPYFVPDESLVMSLTNAAQRGVQVTLVNSEAVDQAVVAHAQRSYYEEILRAGVDIRLYHKPTLLHSKYIIVDDDVALIGSSNMDIRSFQLNQELTVALYDKAVIAELRGITDEYLARTTPLTLEQWRKRPPRKQLLDNLARLTSSLQ